MTQVKPSLLSNTDKIHQIVFANPFIEAKCFVRDTFKEVQVFYHVSVRI